MQYAMLVYLDEPKYLAQPPAEQERLRTACGTWYERLHAAGQAFGTVCLQPAPTATTVRLRGGKLQLHDGPFAETKEVLGGLAIIEAPDLDAALALVRDFPSLVQGFTVELRPMLNAGAKA